MAQPSLETNEGVEILPGMKYRMLNEMDLPEINDIVADNYSYQHPIRQTFNLSKEDIGDKDIVGVKQMLASKSCFGTFHKQTGQLVAFATKSVHDKSKGDTIHAARERNVSVARFLKFLSGDVFSELNTNRYLYWSTACVKEEYRSQGIITAMIDFELKHAGNKGCQYVVAIASSIYAQKALRRQGFKALREVKYADYVDPKTGMKPELSLSPIHTSCQLVYKAIQPLEAVIHSIVNKPF